jgi:hypothetical protein
MKYQAARRVSLLGGFVSLSQTGLEKRTHYAK